MIRDVDLQEAPKYVDWLIDFVGRGWVRRTLTDYRGHPYRAHFRVNCHPLVPGLAAYYDWRASNAEPHQMPDDAVEIARHSGHIQALEDSWHVAPRAKNKHYLRQRLRDRRDVDGTLFEFVVAYHHVVQGRSVDLRSITARKGFDLLVQSDSIEAEIECKTARRGAGRKVHHADFETLVASLWPALEAEEGIYLLDILCEDRLESGDTDRLSESVSQRLSEGFSGKLDLLDGRYRLKMYLISGRTKPLTVEAANSLLAQFWNEPFRRPHVFAALDSTSSGAPADTISVSILVCRSKRRDNMLRPLMSALSGASKQVSGTRPSLVSIHIPEPVDWSSMHPQSVLARKLYGQFQQRRRLDVVSGVAFSGLPTSLSRRTVLVGNTPAIFWPNPSALHQLPADFRPAKPS